MISAPLRATRNLRALAIVALVSVAASNAASGQGRGAALPDFTELYAHQSQAVVSIDVTQKPRHGHGAGATDDDAFSEFFRRFGPPPGRDQGGRDPGGRDREFEPQSSGSGFIVSSDGYVVTNAHVVDDASEVTVHLSDRREFTARVVGTDARTDVALLKIDAKNLPRVTVGDPSRLKVGEWVVAIGKPFGLANTMTAGIVSAKGRDLPQENLVPFIQTDVAINPGNSGGPLFDMKGEVIGINSLIYSRTGGYMGLSFAVPIDVAMNAVEQLRAHGHVTRGRIGVQIQNLSPDAATAFGLKDAAGALVNAVDAEGPAGKAGVRVGDIIVRVDRHSVTSSTDLPRIIAAIRPGTRIELGLWRNGAPLGADVVVAELKDRAPTASGRDAPAAKPRPKANRIGLTLADLSDDQRRELEIRSGGVLIEDVVGVVRGNVQPGDVILSIVRDGQLRAAKSAVQLNELLAAIDPTSAVTLQLRRGDNQFFATIKPAPPASE
jgi:serine protease Do